MIYWNKFLCYIFGHKLWSPGFWERGWLNLDGWQTAQSLECRRCKKVSDQRRRRDKWSKDWTR